MINPTQLKKYVIEPELKRLGLYSNNAVLLLMGTAAQESKMGEYLKQLGNGPARGIFQMEKATERDIWLNYLRYKPELRAKVSVVVRKTEPWKTDEIMWNLRYAAAMCRIHYLRKRGAIPNNKEGFANYWKKHYNTFKGRGTVEEFIENYNRYVEE